MRKIGPTYAAVMNRIKISAAARKPAITLYFRDLKPSVHANAQTNIPNRHIAAKSIL